MYTSREIGLHNDYIMSSSVPFIKENAWTRKNMVANEHIYDELKRRKEYESQKQNGKEDIALPRETIAAIDKFVRQKMIEIESQLLNNIDLQQESQQISAIPENPEMESPESSNSIKRNSNSNVISQPIEEIKTMRQKTYEQWKLLHYIEDQLKKDYIESEIQRLRNEKIENEEKEQDNRQLKKEKLEEWFTIKNLEIKEKKLLEKARKQQEEREKEERKSQAKERYTEWLKMQVNKLNEEKEKKYEKMKETRREKFGKKTEKTNVIEENKPKIEQYINNIKNFRTSQRGDLMIPFEEWLMIKRVEKEVEREKKSHMEPEIKEKYKKEKKRKENRMKENNLTKKEKFDKIKETLMDDQDGTRKVKKKGKKKNRKIVLEEDFQGNPSREIELESREINPEFETQKYENNSGNNNNKNDRRNYSGINKNKNKFSGSKGEFTPSNQ